MANQRGAAPAGLTGLFDFPHLGTSGVNFVLDIILWKIQQEGQTRPRMGRGSTGFFAAHRYVGSGGGGVATGPSRGDGFPAPTDWEGAEGSVRIDFNKTKGQYATYAIKVTSFGHVFDSNRDDEPRVTIGFVITSLPTFTGWPGTQPTAASISKADQVQWANSFKSIDPSGLGSSAQRFIDIYGTLTNTDAAEETKLLAVIAAAAAPVTTPHNFKLKSSTFVRDAIDGGMITETWGLTSTADDHNLPRSPKLDDGSDLEDSESISAIETTSTHTPAAAPTGLKYVDTERIKLNDSRWGFKDNYARRTREESIEFDGSPKNIDSSSLADAYSVTTIEANGTHNPPAAADGYVYRSALIIQRHDASTGAKWIHRYDYRRLTHASEIEFAGASFHIASATDLSGSTDLGQVSALRVVTTAADPGDDEPDPNDFGLTGKVVGSRSQALTTSQGSYTGYWQHDYIIAANSAYDEIINRGVYSIESSAIGTDQVIWLTSTSSTFPSNPTPSNTDLQLVSKDRQRIQVTPERWQFAFKFARNTKENELEHTSRLVDASSLVDTETHPIMHTSGTSSPGTPTAVNTDLVLRDTKIDRICVPNGSFTGLFLWTFEFGRRTREADIEMPGTVTVTDQSGDIVGGSARVTVIESDGTSDGGVSVSGLVLRDIEKEQIHGTGKWKHVYIFGQSTREDEIELDGTEYVDDPSDLESMARVTLLNNSSTPVSSLTASPPTVGGIALQLRKITTKKLNTTAATWAHTATYGLATTEEDAEYRGSEAEAGNEFGSKTTVSTVVADTGTDLAIANTTFLALKDDKTFLGIGEVKRITPQRALVKKRYDTADKIMHSRSNHVFEQQVRGVPVSSTNIASFPSTSFSYTPGGTNPGDTQAAVIVKFNFGALRVQPQYILRRRERFLLRRIFSEENLDKFFLATATTVNDDAFLGYLEGEVMYVGPIAVWDYTISGKRRLAIDFCFEVDSWKWFSDALLPTGSVSVNTGSITSTAAYGSTALEAGFVCTFPQQSDFGGFTA